MKSDQKPIDEILCAAIELQSDTERLAYLDHACGEDTQLRRDVEELLVEHVKAEGFMDKPAAAYVATVDWPSPTEQLDTHIGPYKLVEEIGEGGMGTVFMALQKTPVRRNVALKVIKLGMDSRQVVSRFEAERQVLALMDHPNIAKVHDGGVTPSGRPYFVMELVKGIPITDYADQHRLSTEDRLGLFGDVCRAVQHAHQKGIIHRDLKPSNILVTQLDGRATPKIIDFGIAKATNGQLMDGSLVTAYSQLVGTPTYMSPEQAEPSAADVDTRSDVYSLGVLLYELLTGTTPFDRNRMSSVPFDEMRRIIREEDPPRPSMRLSTLNAASDTVAEKHHTDPRMLHQRVSGELDWIVMKSLEKDRARRYPTANDFARDIERYLHDEPVEACPPSVRYRFGKFTRRNRTAIISATVLLLSLVVALAAVTTASLSQRKLAEQLRDRDHRRLLVQQTVNDALTHVALLRGHANPTESFSRASLDQAKEKVQRALALAESGPEDPQLLAQTRRMADELDELQRYRRLSGALQQARLAPLSSQRDLLPFNHEQNRRSVILQALSEYGIRADSVRSSSQFGTLAKPVGAIIDRASGQEKNALLEALHEVLIGGGFYYAAFSQAPSDLDMSASNIGVVRMEPGGTPHDQDIRAVSRHVLNLFLTHGTGNRIVCLLRPGEEEPFVAFTTVWLFRDRWVWDVLTSTDLDPWRRRLRESWFLSDPTKQHAAWERLADDPGAEQQPVGLLIRLAIQLQSPEVAVRLLIRAQRQTPNDVAVNLCLAEKLMVTDPPQVEEALRYYTVANALMPESSKLSTEMGIALRRLGRREEAETAFRRAIDIAQDKAAAHFGMGWAFVRAGDFENAVVEFRETTRLAPQNAAAHNNLGVALHKAGKTREAAKEYREATLLAKDFALAHNNLGRCLSEVGRVGEAITEYKTAIAIDPGFNDARDNLQASESPQAQSDASLNKQEWLGLALEYAYENNARRQHELLERPDGTVAERVGATIAKTVKRQIWPDYHTRLGISSYRYAQWNEALSKFELANNMQHEGDARNQLFLAMTHWQLGNKGEAKRWYDRGLKSMDTNKPSDKELIRTRAEAAQLLGDDALQVERNAL